MATSHLHNSRYQHEQRITVASWIAVLFIATAWMWIHHTASAGPEDPPLDGPAGPARPAPSMPAWLAQSQPLVDGLVVARNNIAAAAAQRDLSATGAACQSANSAVESLHQQMPSPEPALTSTLQHVISSYTLGLHYCISASKTRDGEGIQKAVSYIADGDDAMRIATDMLGSKPFGQGVLIV